MPANVLDLFAEFRNLTNGLPLSDSELEQLQSAKRSKVKTSAKPPARKSSLLGALAYYGLPHMDVGEKTAMRDLVLSKGPWTSEQQIAIRDYCNDDVIALARLLPAMTSEIDLPRALLRGRYMIAISKMEHVGIPIDLGMLTRLRKHWELIKVKQVQSLADEYGDLFNGVEMSQDKFSDYLDRHKMAWPMLPSGALSLDKETFRDMAQGPYPQIMNLYQVRSTLAGMRLNSLEVGDDSRNRCMLSPFASKTARNQPSSNKFIFGPSAWMRGLIKPGPGQGVAYIDWSQQEFGIAAALSSDPAMIAAYHSGDPYMEFARQAGAAPPNATKATHGSVREQYKACVLAVQYGMEADSLGLRIGQPPARARELLMIHRQTYAKFWAWSDAMVAQALLFGRIQTRLGWVQNVAGDPNPRSLANFPMQAHGAELMRVAAILATEAGIEVVAPVHDSFLFSAPWRGAGRRLTPTKGGLFAEGERIRGGLPPVSFFGGCLGSFEVHGQKRQEDMGAARQSR